MPASLNSQTIWQILSVFCPSHGFPGAHRVRAQGIPLWEGSTHVCICCVLAKEQGESSWDGAQEQPDPYPHPPTRTPGRSRDPQSSGSRPPPSPQPGLGQEPAAGRGKKHTDWLYHRFLRPYAGSLPPPASVSPSDKGG